MAAMTHPTVYGDDFRYDEDPPGFRAGFVNVGEQAGATATNVKLYLLPPGESMCPYHYEYEEEWLLVLGGSVALRTPAGTETLTAGALVCFAPGPDGAHRVSGAGEGPARVLMFSSSREPSVAVYPDSDKIGVWTGDGRDELMVRREDARRDYWDGEPTA